MMRKMGAFLACSVLLVVILSSCQGQTGRNADIVDQEQASSTGEEDLRGAEEVPEMGEEREYVVVENHTDLEKIFNDAESLVEASEIVVRGEVVSSRNLVFSQGEQGMPYTVYRLRVSEVSKGDVRPGDEIQFMEPGGIATAEELMLHKKFANMTEKERKQRHKVIFDDVEPCKAGDLVVMFGIKWPPFSSMLGEEVYGLVGGSLQGLLVGDKNGDNFARRLSERAKGKGLDEMRMKREELTERLRGKKS